MSFLFPKAAHPSAAPVTPKPVQSADSAASATAALLASQQASGYASTIKNGGLGVPTSTVRTSTASLLGL